MTVPEVWVVVVLHNLVVAIERARDPESVEVPATRLEVGTRLAAQFRATGSIDGHYAFDAHGRARMFATLCCEFVAALIERDRTEVDRLDAGVEFRRS